MFISSSTWPLAGTWVPHPAISRVRNFRSRLRLIRPHQLASPMVHDPAITQNHLTTPNSARTIIPGTAAGQQSHRNTNLNQQSRERFLMPRIFSRPLLYIFAISLLFVAVRVSGVRTKPAHAAGNAAAEPRPPAIAAASPGAPPSDSTDALRFNTLGVAYMNQQKF